MEMDYQCSVSGKSSLFRIRVEPDSKAYRYDVRIVCKSEATGKEFCLSKQTDITLKTEDNKVCRAIVKHALKGSIEPGHYCYDGKATLYSRTQFEGVLSDFDSHAIRQDEVLGYVGYRFPDDAVLTVAITPNTAAPTLNYSDFKESLFADTTYSADHSVRTFLELVTSEALLAVGDFQNVHGGLLFKSEPKNVHPSEERIGMQLLEGIQKGVRITDAETAWLVLDMKLSYTYGGKRKDGQPLTLGDIYQQFISKTHLPAHKVQRIFNDQFKGVRMYLVSDPSRAILFHALSKRPANSPEYNINGMPVPEYYFNEHDIDLKHPEFPGAQTSIGARKNEVYPLEALQVVPGQLVPQDKNSFEFANVVKAFVRYRFIMDQVNLLSAGEGKQFLENFGVRIEYDSNDVTIKCLSLPKIRVGQGRGGGERLIEPDPIDGNFFGGVQNASFIHTPNIMSGNWTVAFDKRLPMPHIRNFIKKLIIMARNSGLTLEEPFEFRSVDLGDLERVFIDANKINNSGKGVRVDLIMFIDSKENDSHGLLKLLEANYKILTQQITYQVTCDVMQGKNQTLKNIVMKFNSKCLGLNFLPVFEPCMEDLDLEKNTDLLVIGFDVAHPAPASPFEFKKLKEEHADLSSAHPSVVGICANKTEHLAAFSGDFFYQESRRESLSSPLLTKAVQQIIECTFSKGKRQPKRIVVIRDGVSEGQYRMCVDEEIPAIREGYMMGIKSINRFSKDLGLENELPLTEPKITFLVATKRHNKRFFRIDEEGKIQNTRPGDVVGSAVTPGGDDSTNDKVTRQDIPESFVQTHHAIRGTPQITQYTVLLNELNMPVLKVQKFVLLLANMHQVTGCPTSLPLPVYLAHETAKRGQQVYNEFVRQGKNPRFKRPLFFKDLRLEPEHEKNLMDLFEKLTFKFGYAYSSIVHTRFNS